MSDSLKNSAISRDPWLDNAKAGLIVLVVIGHMVSTPGLYYPTFEWMYDFINFFHMPAFLMISGYLMRGRIKRRDTEKTINNNLIPYLTSDLFLYIIFIFFDRGMEAATAESLKDGFSFAEPVYQMWFLLALVVYYFIAIAIKPDKKPALKLAAFFVVAVLLVFFKVTPFLRLTKILALFPYFLIGYLITPKTMDKIKNSKILSILGIIAFGLLALAVINFNGQYSKEVFFMSRPFDKYPLEFSGYWPVMARIVYMPLAAIISVLYLSLVPKKRYFFTKYGERSMYIYVLHAIPVIIFRLCNYETSMYVECFGPAWIKALYLAFCIMLVVVCSSDQAVKVFKPILEPNVRIDLEKLKEFFKKNDKAG